MGDVKVSYLITTHNETDSLRKLIDVIKRHITDGHECVILDDHSTNDETLAILTEVGAHPRISVAQHKLNGDYGAHKNAGIEHCAGKWIFQIDADEYPSEGLISNIDAIVDSNDENEVLWLPRVNLFHGVTDVDAKQWGWRLSSFSDITHNKVVSDEYMDVVDLQIVNFPDFQSRLFRNEPHIRYQRRLHEKVEGFKSYTFIPPQVDIALIHKKTMETQRNTNRRYNDDFTESENKGYNVK
jgi:glycosyltransferase involved in cell wall biosynthesis